MGSASVPGRGHDKRDMTGGGGDRRAQHGRSPFPKELVLRSRQHRCTEVFVMASTWAVVICVNRATALQRPALHEWDDRRRHLHEGPRAFAEDGEPDLAISDLQQVVPTQRGQQRFLGQIASVR